MKFSILILSLFILSVTFTSASPLTVHFLDVGQGDSAIVEHDGHAMLIDAGSFDTGAKILSYLKSIGIKKLDVVVSSHPHTDHIGGMVDVINAIPVRQFIDNGADHTVPIYKDLMKVLVKKHIPYLSAKTGQLINFTDDVNIKVTHPDLISGDINEDSLAFLLKFGNVKIFFPGDCESCDASCDVAKLAHHGSGGSATRGLLKSDDPKAVVISLAKDNDYNYPSTSTLNALKNNGIEVHRTDLEGNVILKTDGKRFWFL